jgi:hypothetical protein
MQPLTGILSACEEDNTDFGADTDVDGGFEVFTQPNREGRSDVLVVMDAKATAFNGCFREVTSEFVASDTMRGATRSGFRRTSSWTY